MDRGVMMAIGAWLITAVYYSYQYTLRSAPTVMMPQLSDGFGRRISPPLATRPLNFTFGALHGPVFGWTLMSVGAEPQA